MVFEPYAPKFPFETWILPKRHESTFEARAEGAARAAAPTRCGATLAQARRRARRPAYNFILHTAPFRDAPSPHYHWHIEIMPTLTQVAGFEWGSGFYINPTPPEEAAEFLREMPEPGRRRVPE